MNDFIELIKPRKWIFLGLVIVFLGLVYAAFSLENDEKNDAALYEKLESDLRAIQTKLDEAEIGLFCNELNFENYSDSFYLILTLPDKSLDIHIPSVKYFQHETFSTSDDIFLRLKSISGNKIRITPQEIKIDPMPLYIFKNVESVYFSHWITLNRADLSVRLYPDKSFTDNNPIYELFGQCSQIPTKVIYDIERENNLKVTENNIL